MNDRTVASGRWRWRPSLRLSLQLVLLATVVLPAVVVSKGIRRSSAMRSISKRMASEA
ncbi:cation transport ATPase [Serpentinimonas maccroryi]|uniref:Cation transport ATPase n=1 Tax=Serpentinimonas maccroryi TaxID=1458426 RepID=A0A060NW99_9BURK|nr:hypothetical protein [Serpentinimonas maccroryi]MCM2479919.1 hypothetical protein [Serpentinimonas maccroryi]MDO9610973.1 hypothetical protein [Serpentinimonas sp.]BAO83808.1 cation transport ATPase [Serpentinimonas maccroryi]